MRAVSTSAHHGDSRILWLLGKRGPNEYHSRSPLLLAYRVRHRILGPLMGCSCSRCFYHPWRIYYWREGVQDRRKIAELEARVRALENPNA